jgi:hypothetical protein
MKTFIAYRSTGEDPKQLEPMLETVRDAFQSKGVDAYCTHFDGKEFIDKSYNPKQILQHAFDKIGDINFLFVLQTSENKSEGMLMEVGYCLAKKIPVIVAHKEGIQGSYLPGIANVRMSWSELDELVDKIKNYEFNGIRHTIV